MRERGLSVRQAKILFLIFHMAAVAYAVFFLHPYYGSNDEFTLAAIASGAYGSSPWYFIYINFLFGWLLRCFYLLFPAWNWYTLVMYGLIFLSLTAIGFTWIGRFRRTGWIMAAVLTLAALSPLYVEMQYTKTAAIVTAAGYVLLFYGGGDASARTEGEDEQRETGRRGSAGRALTMGAGILFLLMGSWIRFQAFGMISLVAFGIWLGRGVQAVRRRELRVFLRRDCAPCVVAFALALGSIALENVLVYTPGSPQEHYREYDRARQELLDYGVPEWDDYQEEYEALGLTRTDVINLENWLIADYDRYTAETFRAIVAFRQDRPFQWEYLKDYLVILVMKPLFLLGAALTLLWLLPFPASGRKRDWIPALWPYAALLGIYLYFIKIYRVLPIVVTACLLGFLIFAWSAVQEELGERWEKRLRGKRFPAACAAGVAVVCGLCVRMLVLPIWQQPLQQSDESVAFRKFYDTISKDKELYYVFDPLSGNGMELGYSIFERIPEDYMTNIFTLGGWETESPQVVKNLDAYGQRNLMTSLYTSDRAVLIADPLLEHLMQHLDETYDGLFLTYSKVNQIDGFNLYTLNYKMSNLKDDGHTARLSMTYTAENGRYDVFEGTVDMTPEELEGKSVFLWMESKESGKRRMYQGTWLQQDEDGLYSLLYDGSLAETSQVRFTIPKLSYLLDDRYEVHIVIYDGDRGHQLQTDNLLYEDGSAQGEEP
ncbi:MAG: hypothetical protein Q4C82_07835 [Eubacteriales bacterium]|nr:hypothetical protein [Eubacteriales bacterium]